jgi:hypothetical protein
MPAVPLCGDEICFTQHIVTMSADSVRGVSAADLDGDGDTDIAAANLGTNEVAWYESDGASPPSFIEHIIATNRRASSFIICIDMNLDGLLDIISSSINDDEIIWYENDGGSPPSFTAHVITTDPNNDPNTPPEGFADAVRMIDVADFDGDGDLDVCSASVDDDKVAWFENPGDGTRAWTPSALTESLDAARAVHAADIDGDGDPDVIAGAWYDRRMVWFENQRGAPPVFLEHVITIFTDPPPPAHPEIVGQVWHITSGDLDADGDLDLVSTRQQRGIHWYENDGASPPQFTRHTLRPLTQEGKEVDVADFDQDGDLDIVSVERWNDKVSWFENLGGRPPVFVEHVLTEDPDGAPPSGGPMQGPADGARSVLAIDMDGDGDADILWGARDNSAIGWEESHLHCPADIDRDALVGTTDLLALLLAWASDPPAPPDLDCNGSVGIGDLLLLLANWGPCPRR